MSSLKKCLFSSSAHLFDSFIIIMIKLCELFVYFEIKPLLAALFANILSPTVGFLLFHLWFTLLC